MKFEWFEVNLVRIEDGSIPMVSGVYVIKQVQRIMGLPISHKIIYIGKSNNLRRRFKEHCDPRTEHNAELFNTSWEHELEFWYAEISKDKIDKVERELIRNLEPITNIVRYRG